VHCRARSAAKGAGIETQKAYQERRSAELGAAAL
jgi:hypothetical protein